MTIRDSIKINDLKIDCIIGILPHERNTPQPVVVDIELTLDLTVAAQTGEIRRTLDYALITEQVIFILEHGKFLLIESAALAIASWLAAPVPTAHLFCVDSVEVRIRKPLSLEGKAVPEIRIQRFNRDIQMHTVKTGDVVQETLFNSAQLAVIRVYGFESCEIPGASGPFKNYKDMSLGSRELLRLAWKETDS